MDNNLPLKELSINEVFNGNDNVTYEIPIYQRNYAWEKDEIAALVRDVWDACEKKNGANYYIGTLVTYEKGDSTFEVIDGQQRLTTLFLLLKSLDVKTNNKLAYRARTSSTKTLDAISKEGDLTANDLDLYIVKGYKYAIQAVDEIVEKDRKEDFINYLKGKVHIVHYNVPKDVDLNHYFEVMNSRGEQLEKHEIVKAKLMNVFADESDKAKFAAIWDACSEMGVYIQTKEDMKSYFVNNEKDFGYINGTFDELPTVNASEIKTPILEDLINSTGNQTDRNPGKDDDSKNSKFQPIIDFPNFLLIVLKITRMGDAGFIANDFILDDKELINEFNKILDKKEIGEGVKRAFAKRFCFNLLQAKYLLDNYVVHHTNEEDVYGHNPWQLQRWTKEEKGSTKNLYDNEMDEDKNIIQAKMVQLLSMFEVSFTARQRKNYLFYVLYHLFENRDIKAYCDFLEILAKKYFYDIYMKEGLLNEIHTPRPGSFDQAVIKDGRVDVNICNTAISADNFNTIYGDGNEKTKGIPLFVFNYMDYCLWKKYAENMAGERLKEQSEERKEFFSQLGCSDFGLDVFKRFYFSRTRRSLEHYYPQALAKMYPGIISDDQINCFGNFAMIGSDANSSGSNWTPIAKLLHYLDPSKKVRQVGVASLKFRIMMQMCHDNDNDEAKSREAGQEWMFADIKRHQDLMLKILFEQV